MLWLGNGIVGDDTHGHVDDLCRFVNPNTVVIIQEKNSHDENYTALKENYRTIAGDAIGEWLEDRRRPLADAFSFVFRRT